MVVYGLTVTKCVAHVNHQISGTFFAEVVKQDITVKQANGFPGAWFCRKPEGRAGFWKKSVVKCSRVAKCAKFSHDLLEGGEGGAQPSEFQIWVVNSLSRS